MTPSPAEVRGRGSQLGSGPCPAGPSTPGLAFRVVPFASRYVFNMRYEFLAFVFHFECSKLIYYFSRRVINSLGVAPVVNGSELQI